VVFSVTGDEPPAGIVAGLKRAGVLINAVGGRNFRAVTHLDVGADNIEQAGEIVQTVLTRR